MKQSIKRLFRVLLLLTVAGTMASCEPPAVYGSVGYSSYSGGGYYGGGGLGTSITVGGRIF